jgi:hypothetical protein
MVEVFWIIKIRGVVKSEKRQRYSDTSSVFLISVEVPKQDIHSQIDDSEGYEQEVSPEENIFAKEESEKWLVREKLSSLADKWIEVIQERKCEKDREIHEDKFVLTNWFMTNYVNTNDKQEGLY